MIKSNVERLERLLMALENMPQESDSETRTAKRMRSVIKHAVSTLEDDEGGIDVRDDRPSVLAILAKVERPWPREIRKVYSGTKGLSDRKARELLRSVLERQQKKKPKKD